MLNDPEARELRDALEKEWKAYAPSIDFDARARDQRLADDDDENF